MRIWAEYVENLSKDCQHPLNKRNRKMSVKDVFVSDETILKECDGDFEGMQWREPESYSIGIELDEYDCGDFDMDVSISLEE